jgi:isocitrate/isopropylmalate dehydrogenase
MKLLVVPGDGIGPEICAATVQSLKILDRKFGLGIEFETAPCGLESLRAHGTTVRPEDVERAKAADGVILGPMSVNEYPAPDKGGLNVPAAFRKGLALYANVRPCYTREGVPSTARQMDLVFVRENLEDFYVDRNLHWGHGEFLATEDVAIAIGKITAQGSRRAAVAAFDLARRRRKKVTVVHKAPVLIKYNGLFLDQARLVAKDYPDVMIEDIMVDAAAALLIRTPERFDVILTTNMFGDILSDEAAELAGSLGLAASLNHGDRHAVAQAGHGSAPDLAGKNLANPVSLMQSAAMLLEHLGMRSNSNSLSRAGIMLRDAVDVHLRTPETRTPDLGGHIGTSAFAEKIEHYLEGQEP